MKSTKIFAILFIGVLFLSSCHTALQGVQPVARTQSHFGQENMEFIGFKNMKRGDILLKDFGAELERRHIAINHQKFYMGIYSLQELETYKASMRYITFIDVVKHSYLKNDAVSDSYGLELGGWLIAGITCFTLFPVYVPMICAADANDCQIILNGEYHLYVYDTVKKEVVMTTPIEVQEKDMYKGQFTHKHTDVEAVNDRYRNLLYNALLDAYSHAYNFVKNINE